MKKYFLGLVLFAFVVNNLCAQSLQQEFNKKQLIDSQAKNNSDYLDNLANNINSLGTIYQCEDLKIAFVDSYVFIDWKYGIRKEDSYKVSKSSNSYSWKIVSLLTAYGDEIAYKHVQYEFIPNTKILLIKIETKSDKGKDYTFIQPKNLQGVTKHECSLVSSPQSGKESATPKSGNFFKKIDTSESMPTSKKVINNASADFSKNDINLSVYKTSWAMVDKNLGNINGKIKINFDWSIESEGWWENPAVSIVTGGKPKFDLQKCDLSPKNLMCGTIIASENVGGLPVKEFGITSGNFEKVVDATGETTLIFFIKPSGYSSNGDHGYTRFFIRNLKIINLY